APQVRPGRRRPVVGVLPHLRGRGDGVDGDDLGTGVGDTGGGLVAVDTDPLHDASLLERARRAGRGAEDGRPGTGGADGRHTAWGGSDVLNPVVPAGEAGRLAHRGGGGGDGAVGGQSNRDDEHWRTSFPCSA